MQNTSNRRFTCRYWALGPSCPDGVLCQYAHRVTGQVASPTLQPGTCLSFSKFGYCPKLRALCGYEHRHTGVTGLYQGTLELVGFELQVANIAYNAGFNTTNHERLFDLIWAIKRMALQNVPRPRPARPPPHPIYPDRYRPNGVGDNTNKKRKRPNEDVVLKFNPVPPLMQRGGTKEDPIKLESDDEEAVTVSQAPKKRLKISNSVAVPSSNNPIADAILKVKRRLEATRLDVNGCQADMKILFDRNKDRFDDDVLVMFQQLAQAMNKAYDGAKDGVKYADKAASLMTFGGPIF